MKKGSGHNNPLQKTTQDAPFPLFCFSASSRRPCADLLVHSHVIDFHERAVDGVGHFAGPADDRFRKENRRGDKAAPIRFAAQLFSVEVEDQLLLRPEQSVNVEFLRKVERRVRNERFVPRSVARLAVDLVRIVPVVDIRVDLSRVVPLVDVDLKMLVFVDRRVPVFPGDRRGRHEPERIVRSRRGGVPVAALKVAVLEPFFGRDRRGRPFLAAAVFFFVHQTQRPVLDDRVLTPAAADDVPRGAVFRVPVFVQLTVRVVELVRPNQRQARFRVGRGFVGERFDCRRGA